MKSVHNIPILANINGTNAHGLDQSIISGVNLLQPPRVAFGAHPGSHVTHVSLST